MRRMRAFYETTGLVLQKVYIAGGLEVGEAILIKREKGNILKCKV